MKTFIKSVVVAVMVLFAGASFAQGSHPSTHHHYKHHKHYKHHRKHHVVHHYHHATTHPPVR